MQLKRPLWGNDKTLPETCIFTVFERVTHRSAKMHRNHLILEKRKTLRTTCLLNFFLTSYLPKTLKRMQSNLYSETKRNTFLCVLQPLRY